MRCQLITRVIDCDALVLLTTTLSARSQSIIFGDVITAQRDDSVCEGWVAAWVGGGVG